MTIKKLSGLNYIQIFGKLLLVPMIWGLLHSIELAQADSMIRGEIIRTLPSHVPPVVSQYSDLGRKPETDELQITVILPLNHEAELDATLKAIYDETSSQFHQFLTPDEFHNRFSPTDDQVTTVTHFLLSQGILPKSIGSGQKSIRASATVKAINKAFSTEIHQYQDSKGNSYFAPAYELQVNSTIPILAVHGLNNTNRAKPHSVVLNAQVPFQSIAPLTGGSTPQDIVYGSGPGYGLGPDDIRKYYNIPASANGSGQILALAEYDGYTASDINAYEKQFGLPAVPLENVLVDGFSGVPSMTGGSSEVSLDIELLIAVAPQASKILVYESPNGDPEVFQKIADDNLASQVSLSWGSPELADGFGYANALNQIFKQMASQGQNFFASSGDSGAYDDGTTLSVDCPASDPYAIAVGGTQLQADSSSARGAYETSWNYNPNAAGSPTPGPGGAGGGGGISTLWSIPSWQAGAVKGKMIEATLGSIVNRNVPDVALSAWIPGYAYYYNGQWSNVGGTSCSAPIWATFAALVNQARASNGLGRIGFISPILYAIGNNSAEYSSDFYDVSDNSTNLYYPAVRGYDNSTGWGSFNGQNLIQKLSH